MSDPQRRILLVEDESPMRVAIEDLLASQGYLVSSAEDGSLGLERALRDSHDLIILDIMLPKLDGFTICRSLRHHEVKTPVLMLTAKGEVRDRVTGLDGGADDYLTKPFRGEELLARTRALLRRGTRSARSLDRLRVGCLDVDFARCTAFHLGRDVHLSPKEFAVLRLLAEAEGEVVSRDRFLAVVWGYNSFPTTRTVDNHIASLRAKVEINASQPVHLVTVHGVGYRLAL